MKEKFLKMLEKLGLLTDENKSELEGKISEVELSELLGGKKEITLPANIDPAMKSLVEGLAEQNKALSGKVTSLQDTLAKEMQQREAAIKAEKERQETESKSKIENAVKGLLDDKKITESDKETWLNLYEKDFEAAEKVAGQLLTAPKPGKKNNKPGEEGEQQRPDSSLKVDRNALKQAIEEQMENYQN